MQNEIIHYKRARFSTRLPSDRRYTGAHYWLREETPGFWLVGFTKFATRMLGDLVEYDFSVKAGDSVALGQQLGSIEGFKALSAIYSVATGVFLGVNSDFATDITLAESDPYGRGWLYKINGEPDPASMDVHAYAALLDGTIDRLLKSRHAIGDQSGDENDKGNEG
jgi:glycine cleavage system H protein